MLSAIDKALVDIKYNIPYEILSSSFFENREYGNGYSLDEQIRMKVLMGRVLLDCNMIAGQESIIFVNRCEVEYLPDRKVVIRVPHEARDGRDIIYPISLSIDRAAVYGGINNSMFGQYGNTGGNILLGGMQQIKNSINPGPLLTTTKISLVMPNVILANANMTITSDYVLRVMLADDENLSTLKSSYYETFVKLCIYATKAYIYNTRIIAINYAEINFGRDIARVKDIIESYSECNELYDTLLKEKWRKIRLLNDKESMNRLITAYTPK